MNDNSRLGSAPLEAKRGVVLEAAELAVAALQMIDKPQRFARRAYALDSQGRSVRVDDPQAARFCLAGALLRAEHDAFKTEIPLRSAESEASDDLLEPLLPPGCPLRLEVAMRILAHAARSQLEALGMSFREIDSSSEEARRSPTWLHTPLLLSVHTRGGHRGCRRALVLTTFALGQIMRNDDILDRLLPDESVVEGASS
jgi:hypothetical protein